MVLFRFSFGALFFSFSYLMFAFRPTRRLSFRRRKKWNKEENKNKKNKALTKFLPSPLSSSFKSFFLSSSCRCEGLFHRICYFCKAGISFSIFLLVSVQVISCWSSFPPPPSIFFCCYCNLFGLFFSLLPLLLV